MDKPTWREVVIETTWTVTRRHLVRFSGEDADDADYAAREHLANGHEGTALNSDVLERTNSRTSIDVKMVDQKITSARTVKGGSDPAKWT